MGLVGYGYGIRVKVRVLENTLLHRPPNSSGTTLTLLK